MKVTSIRQQVKNPQRVSVFVDARYAFSLSLDELVTCRLASGQELTEAELKKMVKISNDGKLRARSLEWLLNRPHSTREFKDYLYRKKADLELAHGLIEEFRAKGYLNDAKFAEWFIDVQSRRHKSLRAIRAELARKGVGREEVETSLAKSPVDEEAALKSLIDKKIKTSRYKTQPQKLARYLTSQGFSYEAVKKQLAERLPED